MKKSTASAKGAIQIIGARQNNLNNIDISLPHNELIVITGVSGSGKSSLAFDTVFAEAQRRYVETFSPYARQFLDRMDRPHVDKVLGIPPGIAIDQTNPVRTSRSTVGTMTELNDHLKLMMARCADLYCHQCAQLVKADNSDNIATELFDRYRDSRVMVSFRLEIPEKLGLDKLVAWLDSQGFTKIHDQTETWVEVIQDRLRLSSNNQARLIEALESALRFGQGEVRVTPLAEDRSALEACAFSTRLHCANCDITYQHPSPSHFSFNSPIGACDTCRGFGRTMGIDYNLVIPNVRLSLSEGCIRPWQTKTNAFCQRDVLKFSKQRGIDVNLPWAELSESDQQWIIAGDGPWDGKHWYGIKRFFDYLETQSYKMHIRVLLSKYRSYEPCPSCEGARLKMPSLIWRVGNKKLADETLAHRRRFMPKGVTASDQHWQQLPGLCLHDIMLLPLGVIAHFFNQLKLPGLSDIASKQLLNEVKTRLSFLTQVGLHYLTLDRQSRTLSGGEVQRINLTTALGTSLVNTLFVLDEPSIGLHPRDMDRVIKVMQSLRDAGNTLLVVEHDPQVMLAADRIIDMGPGAGKNGGKIQFNGSVTQLMARKTSLTAQYLRGEKSIGGDNIRGHEATGNTLDLLGASANNLKGINLHIPLQQLVCVTGVSGSGKSTLIQDTLCNALFQQFGTPKEAPGEYISLDGHQQIDALELVDQSPIGKTTRSNPASYTGALESIRKIFATLTEAKDRGYTAGSFSFNSGMKCPACSGNGFEHVEMQFLSDVYLRCGECNGTRYRAEVLEVKMLGANGVNASIADVLAMTSTEALAFFADQPKVIDALEPLIAVGLDYLQLGQAVPTLSGGEAQRLKLAAHLTKANSRHTEHTLFIFDEPTTGLHFEDIAKLNIAFRRLLDVGHSVLVVEHNLDVILESDHIIDMGPEGGDNGGEIIAEGSLSDIMKNSKSHTGRALKQYKKSLQSLVDSSRDVFEASPDYHVEPIYSQNAISIQNAHEHNLRGFDIEIPHDKLTVITGLSGSGKSTLAFDILFAEGQRRYLESLNAYARQFVQPASRPAIDALYGMPPTVAIEQRTSRGGRKSTVATLTEIHHYLRLLFVKLGTQYCPDCKVPIESSTVEQMAQQIMKHYRNKEVTILAPLIVARKGYYTDLAQWAAKKGFATLRVDGEDLSTHDWPRLDRYMLQNCQKDE